MRSNGTGVRLAGQPLLRWLWHWLPPLLWMAGIFYLSAQPDLPHAPAAWLDVLIKKGGHAGEYLVLFLLLCRAWGLRRLPGEAVRWARGATVLYAISDELHQGFVPGRHMNWYDVVIDLTLVLPVAWLLLSGRLRLPFGRHDDDLPE